MLRQRSLLTMSVAFFAAAVLGVQLGQSAIGAIHPLYFEGEAPSPRAVDGRERQPGQPAYYQAYDWRQGAEARAIACGDNCGPPVPYDPYAYAETPQPRLAGAHWRDSTPVAELEPWPAGQVSAERNPVVLRFADFPVEEKPEEADGQDKPGADAQPADVHEDRVSRGR